jgi:hypothetical protein
MCGRCERPRVCLTRDSLPAPFLPPFRTMNAEYLVVPPLVADWQDCIPSGTGHTNIVTSVNFR